VDIFSTCSPKLSSQCDLEEDEDSDGDTDADDRGDGDTVATMSAMAKVSVVSTLAGTAYWEFGLGQELGYTRSECCKYQCCLDSGCVSDVVDTKAYNDGRELCVM
jgi:hypothetical protein